MSPSHPHPYPQRPSSRCENLLRETLLKDELQREREMYDDKPHPRGREEPKQRRRASLQRSVTEGSSLPRAASLSPTRRLNQHHRLHHQRSHNHLHQHVHAHLENPYDQVVRARLERVLTSACGVNGADPSCSCCHGYTEHSSKREKRVSFPATPLGGGGGFFGWFWREGDEEHADPDQRKYDSEYAPSSTAYSSHSEHAYHLPTPQRDGGHLQPVPVPLSTSYSSNRARSLTAPSSSRHSPTLLRSELPSRSGSSSAASSPPRKDWIVPIPLETVYSGEAVDATSTEPGLVERMATDEGKGKGKGPSVTVSSDEGMLTPPPTPPGEGREVPLPIPSSSTSRHHRRTHSAQAHATSANSPPKTKTQHSLRPRALSARVPSSSGDSPVSSRSLPLPPTPILPPPTFENPRKFNVRTASAQLRQVEGLVSFMAVEGLGEPEPEPEEEDGAKGKKGLGIGSVRRWLLF
ncbi:hypothetical protein AAF712_002886 [Marasmius tenuissimus]|uniref:Uncharacterized protein n=1 Tax=Marasmius tenuissimus TaxID=585030 RepID=A0ABR3A9G9_9AGAR